LLVFTDLFVVDDKLKIISPSMWKYTHLDRVMDLKYLLISPFATGCTMLFNDCAKQCALKNKNKAIMHDSLLTLTVLLNGGVIKGISNSLIYYRQHNNNTLGTSIFNNSLIYRIINIRKILKKNYEYYKFSNSIMKISMINFLYLKIEAGLKIRISKTPNNLL